MIASISPANVLSSMSRKTCVSVFQVTGCLPLPATHSSMISILISFTSLLCLWARARILAPLWSSSKRRPNSRYLIPISWGILILLSLPRNLMHSIRVGWSVWSSIGAWSMKGMKLANSYCIVRQKVKTATITVTIQLWNILSAIAPLAHFLREFSSIS